ncbi:MAG: DUF1367 family protein [Candidatus Scalindua sp.]
MTEIVLMKMPGGYLIPATDQDKQLVDKIKTGEGITVKYSKKRKLWFHRKYFALLNLGFDAWEPDGEKSFERFRKDIVILTGHYSLVTNIKGESRAEAKSISFGNMSEDEFEEVYSITIDVLIKHVMKNYTRDDVDSVVNELLGFAA